MYYIDSFKMHSGLLDERLRDYLSVQLCELQSNFIQKKKVSSELKGTEYSIRDAELEIEYHTANLRKLKNIQAVQQVVAMNDWEVIDCSDVVENLTGLKLCPQFIGTQEEFESLQQTVKSTQ